MSMETARIDKEKKRDAIGFSVTHNKLWLLKRKHCFLNTEFVGNSSLHGAFTRLLSKKKNPLLNGNCVLAGGIACNNRLQATIFTTFCYLIFWGSNGI